MTHTPGHGHGDPSDTGPPDVGPLGEQQALSSEVLYAPLQAWSRPHPAEGVVTVHFATQQHPERRFTLTAAAARELAIQLMRHSKRVLRALGDDGQDRGPGR